MTTIKRTGRKIDKRTKKYKDKIQREQEAQKRAAQREAKKILIAAKAAETKAAQDAKIPVIDGYGNIIPPQENIPQNNGLGRPKGAKNRKTLMLESLTPETTKRLLDDAVKIALKGVDAVEGDPEMIRYLLDKIHPKAIHKTYVKFDLDKLDNLEDLQKEMTKIVRLVSEGDLSLEEGNKIVEDLEKIKGFIMGTKIEAQYKELSTKLESLGFKI